MMTGRVLHHYNTAAMTDKAPGVEELGCEDGNANLLTIAALDPVSSTPEFKVCAIKVEKI